MRRLAGDRDPIEVVTEHARNAVLRALDSGWTGPPFDPLALADLLNLVVVPNDAVRDARTVPVGKNRVQIEFNPNRPRGRMRYSLAHEIAHTFFPDCAERVRDRAAHSELTGDDWQLEALCNIAAAELLIPAGSFNAIEGRRPAIDLLLAEQRRFDVSTEALLIRAARVADESFAMFCASRVEEGRLAGRYQLDYVIPSRTWHDESLERRGGILPSSSAVAHCSGIGFTARAEETWGGAARGLKVHVECAGIPPYPGARVPRVAGVFWGADTADTALATPSISVVRGDATKPRGDGVKLVVQVVNDATPNWGGGGFATAVRRAYPDVQADFQEWWGAVPRDARRLGQVRIVRVGSDIWVASVIAQHGYGASASPRIRYAALRQGLDRAAKFAAEHGASVHMPRIGCGQAGGSWVIVEELVRETIVAAGRPVIVYDTPDANLRLREEQPSLELFAPRTTT